MNERKSERGRASWLALILVASVVALDVSPAGAEFPVNSYTTGDQGGFSGPPQVSRCADGRFVVVWSSAGQDGSGQGVFGQRYASTGAPSGVELPINTTTANDQQAPAVAMRDNGDFLVVWEDTTLDGSGTGVYGQLFGSSGAPIGSQLPINQTPAQNQDQPAVAAAGDGYVVTWRNLRFDPFPTIVEDIEGRIYDGAGTALTDEFAINSVVGDLNNQPSVAANGAGEFVVAWWRGSSGASQGIFGRRYAAGGAPLGAEFQVNTFTTSTFIEEPDVEMDEAGGFVVTWQTNGEVSGWDVFARRYDDAGVPLGNEFHVNTDVFASEQLRSDLAVDADGEFLVTWTSLCAGCQDGSGFAVLGRRYAASGAPMAAEFVVNTFTTGNQDTAAVAMSDDFNAVVVWTSPGQDGSGSGVFGQRYDPVVFRDGFEAGDPNRWSSTVP